MRDARVEEDRRADGEGKSDGVVKAASLAAERAMRGRVGVAAQTKFGWSKRRRRFLQSDEARV